MADPLSTRFSQRNLANTAFVESFVSGSNIVYGTNAAGTIVGLTQVPFATSSSLATSASYAITASHALNTGTLLVTGSKYPITSSWSISSSYSVYSIFSETSSFAVSAGELRLSDLPILYTASFADIIYIIDVSDTSGSNTGTSKQISLTNLFNSITIPSASYALTASKSISSSYSITSSYTISSSYAATASIVTSAQNAQDILVYVKNDSGQILPKGTVVRITGVDNVSNFGKISLANFTNESNSANTLGFTNEQFAIDAFGYVITEGYLTGVNTSNFTSGDLLYLSSSGTYTNVSPTAPLYGVKLGQAIKIQPDGTIYVRIDNGIELGEAHNVIDNTTSSSYGDLLVKSGSVWINSKNLTGSYTATGSFSGQTGSFIYFNINNTGSAPTNPTNLGHPGEIRFDNNFIYIYTNSRWVRTPIAKWTS